MMFVTYNTVVGYKVYYLQANVYYNGKVVYFYVCMSVSKNKCRHRKISFADIKEPHKIRLFYKMSACLQNIYYI